MSLSTLNSSAVSLLAEEGAEGGGINAYLVGAITLAILLALLVGLLMFGAGRDHS